MPGKIITLLTRWNLRRIGNTGGLACPECGRIQTEIPTEMDAVVACPACHFFGSVMEWVEANSRRVRPGHVGFPPSGTRVTCQRDESTVSWNIPPPGRSGGLILFGVIWSLMAIALTSGLAWSLIRKGGLGGVLVFLFLAVIVGSGAALLYFGFRLKHTRHQVTVGNGRITLAREWRGGRKERFLSLGEISRVYQVAVHTRNRGPRYRIAIEGESGRLLFGDTLTDAERAWVVAEIGNCIWPAALIEGNPQIRTVLPISTGEASFLIPVRSSSSGTGFSVFFTLVSAVLLVAGLKLIPGGRFESVDGPAAVRAFDFVFDVMKSGFRVVWLASTSITTLVGCGLLISFLRSRGRETQIEGTARRVFIRKIRKGKTLEEKSFARATLLDVRSLSAGSHNAREMKRVELLFNDRAECVAWRMSGENADELVKQVKLAMR